MRDKDNRNLIFSGYGFTVVGGNLSFTYIFYYVCPKLSLSRSGLLKECILTTGGTGLGKGWF